MDLTEVKAFNCDISCGSSDSCDEEIVLLHQCLNAWKPSYKRDQPTDDKERIRRHVQAILNKLTFQKFQTLLLHFKKFEMNAEDTLNLIANLIFENAVYEPHFSNLYAHLCKHLHSLDVNKASCTSKTSISDVLLNRCQEEICKIMQKRLKPEDDSLTNNDACDTLTKKYKLLGTVRFVADLYKVNLFDEAVIQELAQLFFEVGDEQALECLIVLLKIGGKALEENSKRCNKKGNHLDSYFFEIQSIVSERITSPRIRFLLMDLIELRQSDWIPRHNEIVPRLSQIHIETENESNETYKTENDMKAVYENHDANNSSSIFDISAALSLNNANQQKDEI